MLGRCHLLSLCGYLLTIIAARADAKHLHYHNDAIGAMKIAHLQTLLALTPAALGSWPEADGKTIQYSSVLGYFLQDDPATDPSKFDYVSLMRQCD